MGNCLVLQQQKIIKVMKTDGKILEYKPPIRVQEVLSEFTGHLLSDSLPEIRRLRPDVKLLGGQLYFLVPKAEKKKVRFSDQEVAGDGQGTGIVRIKLVISKQELQELLRNKGGVSVQDMISLSQIQSKQSENGVDFFPAGSDNNKGWKPELESIPEADN